MRGLTLQVCILYIGKRPATCLTDLRLSQVPLSL